MLFLDTTTRSLEVLLAAAVATNQAVIQAGYVDFTATATTPASSNLLSNGITAVTAVAAPAASTQRQLKILTVYNNDTVSVTVTVQYNDNGTNRILTKTTLAVGDTLQYVDGQGFRVIDTNGNLKNGSSSSLPPLRGLANNLKIQSDAVAPNTKVNITADELVLKDTNNVAFVAVSVNVNPDASGTGANGLDTGALANSTWYYLWVIYNGTTVAGLISTSSTAPTMPSGYTFKAMLGAVRTDGSAHFTKFWQSGNTAYIGFTNVFNNQTGVTSFTAQSISTIVPPTATRISGCFGASAGVSRGMALAGDATGTGEDASQAAAASNNLEGYSGFVDGFEVPMGTPQTVYWKALDTSASYRIDITGWSYP
jgi:hypothetical protein